MSLCDQRQDPSRTTGAVVSDSFAFVSHSEVSSGLSSTSEISDPLRGSQIWDQKIECCEI